MRSLEPRIRTESEYYVYHPSAVAAKLYLYPTSVGEFFYEAGYHLRRASFDSFLLMYLVKGYTMVFLDGRAVRVPEGSFVLLDCYDPHEYYYEEDAQTLWLHFDGRLARSYYEVITAGGGNILSMEEPYPAAHIMRSILRQFREARGYKEASLSASITQLLNMLMDNGTRQNAPIWHDRIIENALAFINEHFAEPVSLEELAKHCSMSPFYFSRVFANETGFTPHQYLIATRLNHAKYLLRSTGNISIKEIAFRCGFHSESSFCATFRKWENMTPSECRHKSEL